ncbi:MAG: alpha/beta hydrolase-fold protein [candidate division KSB1 bacterium]|nr:alpha/beta hydrolase-fold protein [candidate division KSB1 bacterium]MDZ7274025.1 alpha/beta hydrolase-fold protein [candidate division KSB1 bacterium]MDZ7286398.1 alpha/beta hydrolase-fold protein [candidate division KSB1 bacterium]MDZ7296626.1 alpha/beta hydrolase-fold protein [candidate division KSB1 bacterium]MDZ7306848.1 alpha/beta hydrolase-fold protein [candidate division KSB1 bacterium]
MKLSFASARRRSPSPAGRLVVHRNFESKILGNQRDLIVWLPPGYEQQRPRRYPVLYAHDGQNLFDPATAYLGVDWQMGATAEALILQRRVRPFLLVGIYNTPARQEEYTPIRGRAYAEFLLREVMPFISREYRIASGRRATGLLGSSLGGLISFYLTWWHPEVFGMAACLSASWMWQGARVFKDLAAMTTPRPRPKIYLDHGSEGAEGDNAVIFHRMRDTLVAKGFALGKDLEYFYGVGDRHDEASWARRAWRPLVFFFGTAGRDS